MICMIMIRFPRAGRAPHVAYRPTQVAYQTTHAYQPTHVAYRPTQGLPGVHCAAGTGMVNPDYRWKQNVVGDVGFAVMDGGCRNIFNEALMCRDTEQEMADMTTSANPFARPSL